MKLAAVLLSAAVVLSPAISVAKGGRAQTTLDAQEIATAQFMREEEKLARDVYRVMFQVWGNPIFSNIAASEQAHMDAMANLLENNGIEDPVDSNKVGEFTDQSLAEMFDELTERGEISLEEALHVGALIEEVDILDIRHAIDETDERDFVEVYESLLKGSRNHLRAFVSQLENLGVVYEPQLLTPEELSNIVDSPMERGSQ
jgi:hypothetical protein